MMQVSDLYNYRFTRVSAPKAQVSGWSCMVPRVSPVLAHALGPCGLRAWLMSEVLHT